MQNWKKIKWQAALRTIFPDRSFVISLSYLAEEEEDESDQDSNMASSDESERRGGNREEADSVRERLWNEFCKHMMERFLQVCQSVVST